MTSAGISYLSKNAGWTFIRRSLCHKFPCHIDKEMLQYDDIINITGDKPGLDLKFNRQRMSLQKASIPSIGCPPVGYRELCALRASGNERGV